MELVDYYDYRHIKSLINLHSIRASKSHLVRQFIEPGHRDIKIKDNINCDVIVVNSFIQKYHNITIRY